MENKVKVGQIWRSKYTYFVVSSKVKFMGVDMISIIMSNGVVSDFTFNEAKEAIKKWELITDKYVGDWKSAIASPEFKGE